MGGASRAVRICSTGAIVGAVAYILIDALLALLDPRYSLLHNAESDYGVGSYAWLMDLNFLLRAACSLAALGAIRGAGLRRSAPLSLGSVLIAVWALGSGLLAFFPDNIEGQPPTASGRIHLALAAAAFLALILGSLLISLQLLREPAWRSGAPLLLIITLVALGAFVMLPRSLGRLNGIGGLWERIFLGLEIAWMALLAALSARRSPAPLHP